jgi:phytoene dehydrogenase-like protein
VNDEHRTSNVERRTSNDLAPDAVLIGAGVNGLVTATLLARGGVKVLFLERSDRVGGCARTD